MGGACVIAGFESSGSGEVAEPPKPHDRGRPRKFATLSTKRAIASRLRYLKLKKWNAKIEGSEAVAIRDTLVQCKLKQRVRLRWSKLLTRSTSSKRSWKVDRQLPGEMILAMRTPNAKCSIMQRSDYMDIAYGPDGPCSSKVLGLIHGCSARSVQRIKAPTSTTFSLSRFVFVKSRFVFLK